MEDLYRDLGQFTFLAVLLITIIAVYFHAKWSRRNLAIGPTFLTTLGIFFCFLGIALGLGNFNPDDIRNSVPDLLDGIRTSFWASVAGIFWALTIKGRAAFFGDPALPSAGTQSGATVDDLANQLMKLNRAIAGEEDSTLLSQLKLLRTDSKDGLERLNRSFDEFARRMTEANTKALIEALSSVIRDFNQNLTEQFGENFKQLNAAVERLVTWQIQYEKQLSALIEQETATRRSMTEASLRYAELVNKAGVFTGVAESMDSALRKLAASQSTLEGGLQSLAGIIVRATEGLPQLDKRIMEMIAHIERGVQKVNADMTSVAENIGRQVPIHNQQLTNLLTETLNSANTELNRHIRQSVEDSKKQIVALDTALERELTTAMQGLGRQLTALSSRFVEDYAPLTEKLQRLVTAARV